MKQVIYVFLIIGLTAVPSFALQVVDTFEIEGLNPTGLIFSGGYLIVSDRTLPTLAKIDTDTGNYIDYNLDERESVIWMYPYVEDNYILAQTVHSETGEKHLDKIYTGNMSISESYVLPGRLSRLRYIPDSDFAIGVCGMSNHLFVIDYTTMEEKHVWVLQDSPQFILLNSAGTKAYISHYYGGYITIWDISDPNPANYYVEYTIQVSDTPGEIAYSETNDAIYVCCGVPGEIWALSGTDGSNLTVYETGVRSIKVDYDPAHNYLWVAQGTDDNHENAVVHCIDLGTEITSSFHTPERIIYSKLSPDCSTYIATVGTWGPDNQSFRIWSIDCASLTDEVLETGEGLLFVDYSDDGLAYILDCDGSAVLKVQP